MTAPLAVLAWLCAASVTGLIASGASAEPGCTIWPPTLQAGSPARRPIRALDLVSLRDFGDIGVLASRPFVALSPDGRHVALILRQARPASNDYCSAIVIASVDGREPARAIVDAGPVQPARFDKYGIIGIDLGVPRLAPIRWSPDGQWIAWVKDVDGQDEIWRVRPDGRDAAQVLRSRVMIDQLAWTGDGGRLVFSSKPDLISAQHAIEQEGRTGYHYDGRFWPLVTTDPYVSSSIPEVVQSIEPGTGRVRAASEAERDRLDPDHPPGAPVGSSRFAESPPGDRSAWTAPPVPGSVGQPLHLHIRVHDRSAPCPEAVCGDVVGFWWLADGKTILVQTREGVARSLTGLYRWRPDGGRPLRILITKDALFGCQIDGGDLLCAYEGATQPRRLTMIDTRTGQIRNIFDPNPEWAGLRPGSVDRLSWQNAMGIETFGDLVLPPDYRPESRLPLIVVQYESRGFLRGGTADDYPIQLFAAHGFAVLSFNRPPWVALQGKPKALTDFLRTNQQDWADRRSVQSSLAVIIRELAGRGIIDPTRVGITGQSDGASTATFALIHSELFAAAALSTCCEDATMMSSLGSGFADFYHAAGYPLAGDPAPGFWNESSLLLHAEHHPVPILIQASDQEVRMALPTYATLKAAGWPIDMYIFPGEAHVKFQPAHRLAMYQRSLAWFETWLQPRGPQPPLATPRERIHQFQAEAQTSMSTN